MKDIDGSMGEGGGQIIRSSLALSAVTGVPVNLRNIRAKRSKPGLMRQHLTAVRAAAEICGADVEGAELGSREITFVPDSIQSGDYHFRVGTAGSTTLIAQTILPALLFAEGESSVTLEGGTHNPWAPPFDFFERVYLPHLQRMGPAVRVELVRMGFFPAGGGKFRMHVQPSKSLRGIELLQRQGKLKPSVTAVVSDIPVGVAERECDTIRRKSTWRADNFHVLQVDEPRGPGNVVMIELNWDNVTEIFTGFGRRGLKAEQVARKVYREAKAFVELDAPVGEFLADQLMLPMGLAAADGEASQFRTTELSLHSKTHLGVLGQFLDIKVDATSNDDGSVTVAFQPS